MAPDLLSTIRYEIDERLSELRPLLGEYERLLDAVAALEATEGEPHASGASAVASKGRSETRVGIARRGLAGGAIELAATGSAMDVLDRPAAEQSGEGGSSTRLNGKNGGVQSTARSSRRIADPKPERVLASIARETILGALEHGSHTVGELAVVTAMSGPSINGNLRKLVSEGAVVKTEREGKAAWALADAG